MASKCGVYLLKAVGTPRVKIGWTTNIEKRVAAMATGCPYPLELIHVIKTSDPLIERLVHSLLREYRSYREWFELPKDVFDFFSVATAHDVTSLEIADFLEKKDLSAILPASKVEQVRCNMQEVLHAAGL